MRRFKLTVEYDGGPYVGWQRQANGPSIQQALEQAAHALSDERVTVTGSGRTDAGVHALGQVAHLDLEREIEPRRLREGLTHFLGDQPISVVDCAAAAPDFHARFHATRRSYRYRVLNRSARPALDRGRVWHVKTKLDDKAMHDAAQVLVGKHDFTSFRAVGCQAKSPVKSLTRLTVRRLDEELWIEAEAPSFLHHQIRNITGTLALVGQGKWTPDDMRAALEARSRAAAGPTAPPDGLYLVAVGFDGERPPPADQ